MSAIIFAPPHPKLCLNVKNRVHRPPVEAKRQSARIAPIDLISKNSESRYWAMFEQIQTELVRSKALLDKFEHLLADKERQIELLTRQVKTMLKTHAPMPDNENLASGYDFSQIKILTEQDWCVFQEHFNQRFPNVLRHLRQAFPNITAAETRLFLLTKLDFGVKEIANGLGISVESVWRTRHRLAKKIGLPDTRSLDEIIHQFE